MLVGLLCSSTVLQLSHQPWRAVPGLRVRHAPAGASLSGMG